MFRAMRVAGAGAPRPVAEDHHEEQEEDARNFKEYAVTDAAEGAEESAETASDAAAGADGLLRGDAGVLRTDSGDGDGTGRGRARSGGPGETLASHAPGHPNTYAQHAADGLRSHPSMMLAALQLRMLPVPGGCRPRHTDVR